MEEVVESAKVLGQDCAWMFKHFQETGMAKGDRVREE